MPKKGTKKIFSQKKVQRELTRRQQQRNRRAERNFKEYEQASNANNTTHTVPIKAKPNVINQQETVNVFENDDAFETIDIPNTYPTERQILGLPKKGKYLRKNTRRLTKKQRKQMNLAQTRKQRERAIQQARQLKQEERQLENLLPGNSIENDYDYNYANNQYMTEEEWYNQLAREAEEEDREMERLEKEHEKKLYEKAAQEYAKAQKNTFYFR